MGDGYVDILQLQTWLIIFWIIATLLDGEIMWGVTVYFLCNVGITFFILLDWYPTIMAPMGLVMGALLVIGMFGAFCMAVGDLR